MQFELPARLPYNQRVCDGLNAPIDSSTRLCAVYGHPIRHSASPAMQNAAVRALNLNWCYVACEVHPDNLATAITGAKAMGFIGLNLTVPHKLLALEMVDVVDPRAKAWGAVNTVVFETRNGAGEWIPVGQVASTQIKEVRSHGYNTDADAIIQALREDFSWADLSDARVLLLGAGGAARAAALRLAEAGVAELHLVNRTPEKARLLGAHVHERFPNVELSYEYPGHKVDLVLNATSAGLKETDPLPIDSAWLNSNRPPRVYDMIYRPKITPLLQAAAKVGAHTANGLGMLLHQGAEALRLWSGLQPPVDIMRAALERNIHG